MKRLCMLYVVHLLNTQDTAAFRKLSVDGTIFRAILCTQLYISQRKRREMYDYM
jgi:hypothetical protein